MAGSYTNLYDAFTSPGLTSGTQYIIEMDTVQTNGTTTTIAVTVSTTGGTQIATHSLTDTTSALQNTAGSCGIFIYANGTTAQNDISAVQTYNDTGASLADGAASTTSTGNTIATVSVGNASGGTSPYTYQWYRSTTSGFTPGTGNKLTGATSQTLNDTGLTNGTTYYYVNVVTDSASNTATSNQTSATPSASNILGVNSASLIFSPGNWKGDTGRGGSVYRQTWNPGAYLRARWTAAASGATATILLPSTSTGVTVAYFINGKLIAKGVAATSSISLSGIAAGAVNDLFLIFEASPQTSRWNNGTNTLQIQGIQLDASSTGGTAPTMSNWVLLVGDSITEGTQANAGSASILYDYSYMTGLALLNAGYDYCVNACGYSGYIVAGDSGGDVPAYYHVSGGVYSEPSSRWDKVDSGVSILDSSSQISSYGSTGTNPSVIFINLGTNEEIDTSSTTDLQTSVDDCIAALRTAAPSAKIIIQIPFGLYNTAEFANGPTYITTIKAAIASHSSDSNVLTSDFGGTLSQRLASSGYTNDGIHPVLIGHSTIAPLVTQSIQDAV